VQFTPGQLAAKVGLGVGTGLPLEAGQIGRNRQSQDVRSGDDNPENGRALVRVLIHPSGGANGRERNQLVPNAQMRHGRTLRADSG
jgi:hypothetical protein